MYHGDAPSALAATFTFLSRNDFTSCASSGVKVLNCSPFLYSPWIRCPSSTTSRTSPRSTAAIKSLKITSVSRRYCLLTTVKIGKHTSNTPTPMAICFSENSRNPPCGNEPTDIDGIDSNSAISDAQCGNFLPASSRISFTAASLPWLKARADAQTRFPGPQSRRIRAKSLM